MLFKFITANREELIALTRSRMAKRTAPKPTERELTSGVPLFLDQLAETLRGPPASVTETIERGAAEHGAALLKIGYTVAQVVHDYGGVCQAITELADAVHATITPDEFHTLNLCLDNAIAGAVTEYVRLRERSMIDSETERSGVFAHELRNAISAVHLAFIAIQSGRAPIGGSVAGVVTRNLRRMAALIDRALIEVRLSSGNTQRQRIHLHELLEEAVVDGTMEADLRGVSLNVAPTERGIDIDADPQVLAGAVANILQNAIKFTCVGGRVSLRTSVVRARVEIEVEDECGGLPEGKAEELFGPFLQRGADRSGLGLGLFISRRAVEASGGALRVRDVPGRGCVFTIDLPLPPSSSSTRRKRRATATGSPRSAVRESGGPSATHGESSPRDAARKQTLATTNYAFSGVLPKRRPHAETPSRGCFRKMLSQSACLPCGIGRPHFLTKPIWLSRNDHRRVTRPLP